MSLDIVVTYNCDLDSVFDIIWSQKYDVDVTVSLRNVTQNMSYHDLDMSLS